MLTRKEAVNQMIDNRNKIRDNKLCDILEYISDEMQRAVNKGLGKVYVDLDKFNLDQYSFDILYDFISSNGHLVYAYRYPIYENIKGINIQWDLPWWRRLF